MKIHHLLTLQEQSPYLASEVFSKVTSGKITLEDAVVPSYFLNDCKSLEEFHTIREIVANFKFCEITFSKEADIGFFGDYARKYFGYKQPKGNLLDYLEITDDIRVPHINGTMITSENIDLLIGCLTLTDTSLTDTITNWLRNSANRSLVSIGANMTVNLVTPSIPQFVGVHEPNAAIDASLFAESFCCYSPSQSSFFSKSGISKPSIFGSLRSLRPQLERLRRGIPLINNFAPQLNNYLSSSDHEAFITFGLYAMFCKVVDSYN